MKPTLTRAGFAALYQAEGFDINAHAPAETVLFPEMTGTLDVPEITTACWGILNKDPRELMCSNARMVVRRKGANAPAVLACTLLAYDPQFELGPTLQDANRDVRLNHPIARNSVFWVGRVVVGKRPLIHG